MFIFDFDEPIYGRRIAVEFVHKLRDEERYPDLETLKRQRATALEASKTDPQAVASRALGRHANPYPRGDPRYVPTIEESIERLRATS